MTESWELIDKFCCYSYQGQNYWSNVGRGRPCLLLYPIGLRKHFTQRNDGLFEAVFWRMKDGSPTFRPRMDLAKEVNAQYATPADDPAGVESLLGVVRRNRENEAAYKNARQTEAEKEAKGREERRRGSKEEQREMEERAAEIGIDAESLWGSRESVANAIKNFQRTRTGRCLNCGRLLTDEKSIRSGIGPDCLEHWRIEEKLLRAGLIKPPSVPPGEKTELILKALEAEGLTFLVDAFRSLT